ncbi:MAG: succinate dehydrogenase assembly factor 2 [Gammaproteobacteria bacterium]|jgi:antitoxin CptB|nr:succinate dehydrogenase assembly factor 2 [Gammaproteobacteria bacterium]MCH1550679.1 succinate dehydrogenase assembly factor 2 [Pseudomonadales bacterium]
MSDVNRHKQLYWRSRRGMLELELKLIPFLRDDFSTLSEAEQQAYARMLEEEDWQLFDWLQQREIPQDKLIQQVVDKIIANRGRL